MLQPQLESEKLLSHYSTFGIGGPAKWFTEAHSVDEMQAAIRFSLSRHIPYMILGKGSNCLFDDRGFDGLVILNKIGFCHFNWPFVEVGAGYSFSLLGVQTARNGWAGLEFASGIPGSVGGAVYMNAGACGTETVQCLLEVGYVNESADLVYLNAKDLSFGYRQSSFQNMKGAIVSAKFQLTASDEARKKQLINIEYRTRTQPYGDKSAGCVFRNPSLQTAGTLIQQCDLKGMKIGGAEVSTTHANFIVNKSQAKAQDILDLAVHVKKVVYEKTGVELEMEIRCIPYQFPT